MRLRSVSQLPHQARARAVENPQQSRTFPWLACRPNLRLLTLALTAAAAAATAAAAAEAPPGHRAIPATSVAVLTVATADVLDRYSAAINSKRCYCHHHAYAFVLDTNAYHLPPHSRDGRPAHWNRVEALRRLLPVFEWVVYMDADMLVSNSTPALTAMIEDTARWEGAGGGAKYPSLIVQDGMEINKWVPAPHRAATSLLLPFVLRHAVACSSCAPRTGVGRF